MAASNEVKSQRIMEQGVPVDDLSFQHKTECLYLQCDNPNHSEIKDELEQKIIKNLIERPVKGDSKRTPWDLHQIEQDNPAMQKFMHFLNDKMLEVCVNFACGRFENQKYWRRGDLIGSLGFDTTKFYVAECWGITYAKHTGVVTHCHFPYILSFSYNVNTPKGSAPLIIDNIDGSSEYVEAKEGSLTVFLGPRFHRVEPKDQEAEGRCCLVGNIGYG